MLLDMGKEFCKTLAAYSQSDQIVAKPEDGNNDQLNK